MDYLNEAARLAGLVDAKAMTREQAEEEFSQYITDNGISITPTGIKATLDDPQGATASRSVTDHHQLSGWCNGLMEPGDTPSEAGTYRPPRHGR